MLFSTGLGWSVWGSLGMTWTTGGLVCRLLDRRGWSRIVAVLVCRLWTWHSSAKTIKKGGWRGLRAWPLRCLSQFFPKRKMDSLEGECVAYLSPIRWLGIYSICFPSWMVIRILSHWTRDFLLLSVSDLIDRALYLKLSFFLIGGIWLDP